MVLAADAPEGPPAPAPDAAPEAAAPEPRPELSTASAKWLRGLLDNVTLNLSDPAFMMAAMLAAQAKAELDAIIQATS